MTMDEQSSRSLTFAEYGGKEHQLRLEKDTFMTKEEVILEQMERIKHLPMSKRWPFVAADWYLPIYAGVSGLICNSFFRRMLMIRKGQLLSSIPMAVAPAISVKVGWLAFVTAPILAGDLQCSICGEMRGGLVNFTLGVVYPLIIGLPLSSLLATRYRTVDVPTFRMAVTNWPKYSQFWMHKLRFFRVSFITLAIFHGVVGVVVAQKQMDVCTNELKTKYSRVEKKTM